MAASPSKQTCWVAPPPSEPKGADDDILMNGRMHVHARNLIIQQQHAQSKASGTGNKEYRMYVENRERVDVRERVGERYEITASWSGLR